MNNRYSLRNQKKILRHVGREDFNTIIKSLDNHFKEYDNIELDDTDTKYKGLMISNINHTVGVMLFYVISKTYNAYNLAFKEFIN